MVVGMLAGYMGKRVDNLLMRFTDVVYAFPDLLFFIIVMVALRDSALGKMLNACCCSSWRWQSSIGLASHASCVARYCR